MGQVAEIVLPVFLVIALGYGIRRFGLVDDLFISQVNGLVFYICLPLMLFYKIGQSDFSVNFNPQLVLATSVATGCCFVLAYLYGKWRGFSPEVHGAFCQGSFRGNLAYIGLAIVYNGYGDEGLTRAGILLGFLVPVLNFFAILAIILPQRRQRTGFPEILKLILVNPLILASLAGIFWSFFKLPIPAILDRSLNIVSGMTLPLALLSIGGGFSLKNLRGDFCKAALATTMKLVLLPLITAALMLLSGVTGLDFAVGLLMAGAPTAVATYIMASKMGADRELAGTIVMMATGFSALSFTLLLLSLHAFGM
ncbi:AEC family transporter [Desulfolithobacter sp.]